MYGVEIYSSTGKLVYSSQYPTTRLLAAGTVTISSTNEHTIAIPPLSDVYTPQLWLGRTDLALGIEGPPNVTRVLKLAGGPFVKSGAVWSSVKFQLVVVQTIPAPPGSILGLTPLPWTVPYAVFY